MRVVICLLVSVCLAAFAAADDVAPEYVYAKVLSTQQPKYPSKLGRNGQQGWVDLIFVVSEDGSVLDPVVDQSSGQRGFELSALKAIREWRFEPARRAGEAVPQRSKIRLEFVFSDAKPEVSSSFARRYRKVDRSLRRGDVDAARKYLARAFDAYGLSLGETSWLWALSARIAAADGDDAQELVAVRRALAGSEAWMPADLRASLLKTRFALEVNDGNYKAAIDVFEEMEAIDEVDTSPFAPVVDQIQALADGDTLIVKRAAIGDSEDCESCDARWRHDPVRRAIEITEIDGTLDKLEVRCEWARFRDSAREGVAWDIPEDWGDCTVIVSGTAGTTFKLVELPAP